MLTFKEFLAKGDGREWFTFSVDEYEVHILFEQSESSPLTEAKHRGTPLGGKYSAQLHGAHSSVGQQHLHVYAKNNQLFSLNKDGTAHDSSHQTQIPNKVATAIAAKFPSFKLPKDNFIENAPIMVNQAVRSDLLVE